VREVGLGLEEEEEGEIGQRVILGGGGGRSGCKIV
jgi:hypothetical protein